MRTLAVIPARGGSKGIPNKNVRPLAGQPLISWAIEAARAAARVDAVVVSTDSPVIASVASRFGAEVVMRPAALGEDHVTLDPVIADAVAQLEAKGETFDLVLTIQPTSPLLRPDTIDGIVARFADDALDTILTVIEDAHLSWTREGGRFVPRYAARVNRQQLPPEFRETGGVLATRRPFVQPGSRIGPRLDLHVVSRAEGCDIDSADDWLFAEGALGRRRVAFVLVGNRTRGLGHVARVTALMEGLTGHVAQAFCDPAEDLAIERLSRAALPYQAVTREERIAALQAFGPDIVVHDELDTRREDLEAERALGAKLVCFEDLGAGMEMADLVFNELYAQASSDPARGRWFGPDVCVLRSEFLHAPRRDFSERIERVLVTFGGTDPSGLTLRVLDALGAQADVELHVVAGKGVSDPAALESRCKALVAAGGRVVFHHDVAMMSEVMGQVDVAFCSAGRTLYELAHMRVPAIVLAQNELELKHTFASPQHGFVPLGLGTGVSPEAIRASYDALHHAPALRRTLWDAMNALDLTSGRDRVIRAILES